MKAVLPLIPNAAPSASPEANPPREAIDDGETFASVLNRRSPVGKPRMENADAASAESEVKEVEGTEGSCREQELEAEEKVIALSPPTLILPTLPYHPIAAPAYPWHPIVGDGLPPGEGDRGPAESEDAGISGAEEPAQSSGTISAGPSQRLPILTAMFPIPMAQLQTQLQGRTEPVTREIPVAATPRESRVATLPIGVDFHPQGSVSAGPLDASGLAPQRADETGWFTPLPQRAFAGSTTVREEVSPQRHDPILPSAAVADPTEVAPALSPVSARAAVETLLNGIAREPHGTSAAKRGEVMQATAFPVSPKSREAKSADPLMTQPESVEMPAAGGAGATPASSEIQALAPATTTDAVTRKTPEHRLARGSRLDLREAPSTGVQASAGSQAATMVDPASRKEAEHLPGADSRIELNANVPGHFPAARPQSDRATTEAVAGDVPVSRAELVQIVERTADAAVRMRAVGSERVEVAVQLENGDRLSIQLRIANGEVTPYFRTSSEGLRTALEQNWAQFSDRANDRGVRLTPPVFDVSQSSSNMTDLSQQRHGRDTVYTDAQAELFPPLPRRMRPARVLASAPLESSSAAAVGVRTYA